jgi:enoyl-CoA hydratase/carnithine racemase
MFFTGRMVAADEALALGIVSKVVAPEQLMDTAMSLARQLAKQPPTALALTRKALVHSVSATIEDHLEYEWTNQRVALASAEFGEGVTAFREKREADFSQF